MDNNTVSGIKRFNYLISETDAAYHELALRSGLSDSAMQVLYSICEYGNDYRCPLKEICRRTGISKQTLNSAVRKLETEGFLYSEALKAKNTVICLTDEGKRLAERTAMKVIEIENDILDSWSKEDVETYLELTERFLKDLRSRISN